MQNKIIYFLQIGMIISLSLVSTKINGAYFPSPAIPDYEIVNVSCHEQYHTRTRHHAYSAKHHSIKSSSHKRNPNIEKYYVYSSPDGALIWVPAPCDGKGTWIKVQHTESGAAFSHQPDGNGYLASYEDGVDYDFDTRTGDDIDLE